MNPDALAVLDRSQVVVPRGRPRDGVDNRPVQRRRLVVAVIDALAAHGYADTTIQDVVRRAKVSRRTFYEHFVSRDEAFLVACDVANDVMYEQVTAALNGEIGWQRRLLAGITAFVRAMHDERPAAIVLLRESARAGRAWRLRQRNVQRWAELLLGEIASARRESPSLVEVSREPSLVLAVGLVQGLEAVVLHSVEAGEELDETVATCLTLLIGALRADVHAAACGLASPPAGDRLE